MIVPGKHTDPELSIINISALIVDRLLLLELQAFDELLASVSSSVGRDVSVVYPLALTFLFAIGRLEYIEELDAVRLVS